MKTLYLTISITVLVNYATSQSFKDSVILLNGKSYKCNVIKSEGTSLNFQVEGKKGDAQNYNVDTYRIFSYHQNNTETILYKKNDELGNFLTVDQSRRYAIGSYDGRQTYKPFYVFLTSFSLTYGISIWDTYLPANQNNDPNLNTGFFGKSPTLIPFAAPILFAASFGLPNSRAKDKYMLHKTYINDQMYYNGFNAYAKQKRALSALKGSAIGLGLGLLSYAILKTN